MAIEEFESSIALDPNFYETSFLKGFQNVKLSLNIDANVEVLGSHPRVQ